MSRWHSYLNSAASILQQYSGEEPFASFLKKYFSAKKKYGSRDRKQIAHLCYCYFRLGWLIREADLKERIVTGLFLCCTKPIDFFSEVKPEWKEAVLLNTKDKCSLIKLDNCTSGIFPWVDELSNGIDSLQFNASFLVQPDLFLRVRPGYGAVVKKKIEKALITYEAVNESCISFSNSVKLDDVLELNKEAVIQDYNSQQVGALLKIVRWKSPDKRLKIWDCCAASGGKSIMAKDILGNIVLAVSDIRESIIYNLRKRFSEAGISEYKTFVSDLTAGATLPSDEMFDLVIADVPCSGSGTWSRTPEQLFYFKESEIDRYAKLQQKIVLTVLPHIKPGGYLLYITCSVFKKENEEMVSFIENKSGCNVIAKEWLIGYDKKADTMFASLLQKPL